MKVVQRMRCVWDYNFLLASFIKTINSGSALSLSRWQWRFSVGVRAPEYGPKLIKSGFSCAGTTTLGEILASKQIGAHSFVLQMRAVRWLLARVFVLALLPLLSRRQITLSLVVCMFCSCNYSQGGSLLLAEFISPARRI
jgi:hypothetical protein